MIKKTIIPLLIGLGVIAACTKTKPGSSVIVSAKKYVAENVVLSFGPTAMAAGDEVDRTTKVDVANILLSGTSGVGLGRLTSDNLKDALEKEVAVKLSDVLPGTWQVSTKLRYNGTMLPSGEFTPTIGNITISSDFIFTINSGCFTVAYINLCKGLLAKLPEKQFGSILCCGINESNITVETLSNSVISLSWNEGCGGSNVNSGMCNAPTEFNPNGAYLTVVELTKDKIILLNSDVEDFSTTTLRAVTTLSRVIN